MCCRSVVRQDRAFLHVWTDPRDATKVAGKVRWAVGRLIGGASRRVAHVWWQWWPPNPSHFPDKSRSTDPHRPAPANFEVQVKVIPSMLWMFTQRRPLQLPFPAGCSRSNFDIAASTSCVKHRIGLHFYILLRGRKGNGICLDCKSILKVYLIKCSTIFHSRGLRECLSSHIPTNSYNRLSHQGWAKWKHLKKMQFS